MRPARAATAVLIGSAVVVAVFLARMLLLLREVWRPGAEARDLVRIGLVVGLLAVAEVVLLGALRLRAARRASVALAALSSLVALYGLELGLTLAAPAPSAKVREKLDRLAEMRRDGGNASPGVEPVRFVWAHEPGSPSWLVIDGEPTLPLGGISRRTTLDCKETGDWLVYETDEHGFHNPRGLWRAPVDLAFLGDSFVHGSCVPSEANMVARVRQRRPATLNLGTPGSGPLLMLAQLREYLPSVAPRTVLWCHFSGNDLLDLRREAQHPLLARYLEEGFRQALRDRQAAIDRGLEDYAERTMLTALERRSREQLQVRPLLLLRELRAAAGLLLAAPYRLSPTPAEYALFERVLREARRSVEDWDGRLVFVYLPASTEPPRQLGEAEYHRVRREVGQRTRDLVRALGIPLIDVEEAFEAQGDPRPLYACRGCHYSARGYELAARLVLAEVERGGR